MKRKLIAAAVLVPCIWCLRPHGPAVAVLQSVRTEYVLSGGLEKVQVLETWQVDATGKVWTDSEVIASEPVPGGLPALEAELFKAASGR